MPTPKKGYRNKVGRVIPGTTTIIGRWKESGGLIHWAWQQGLEGLPYRDSAMKAAETGTVVHSMVEEFTKLMADEDFTLEAGKDCASIMLEESDLNAEQQNEAWSAFRAFLAWIENFKVRIIATEIHLVCEQWQFGGTPDAVGYVGNDFCLLDWKTSNGVYTDMLVQLAAYRHLWNTNHPEHQLTGGSHLLRFAKTHGDFAHHFFPNLDDAWTQFTYFRKAFDIDKELKKRAA